MKTFGVLLFWFSNVLLSLDVYAQCAASGATETAQLERVYDGDTVKLTDGRHVRILGINAPEVNHGGELSGQPLGEEAKRATEAFFAKSKLVQLSYDNLRVDHYGRTLAHLYDAQGNSLAAHLLRLGLGFQIAIPPNLASSACLRAAESVAKAQGVGVWRNSYWRPKPASELVLGDGGFRLVRGKVLSVDVAKSIWLELDGPLVVKITPSDMESFAVQDWQRWKGKQVEVRGWIASRGDDKLPRKSRSGSVQSVKPLLLRVRTADTLMMLD